MQPIPGDVVEVAVLEDGRYTPTVGRVVAVGDSYATVRIHDGEYRWLVDHVEVIDR